MADYGYTEKIRVWRASRIFDFVNEFFSQKIQHKVPSPGIQLILNDTKNGMKGVWNERRTKLEQLALNKGHFEKVVLFKLLPLDLWPWAHLFRKKAK